MTAETLGGLLPFVLLALVFYLLLIRPQRRRQQEVTRMQAQISPGAEVMLSSGIYGRVSSLEDETVRLEVSPGTHVKVARRAIVNVIEGRVADPDLPSDRAADDLDGDSGPSDRHQ